MKIKATFSFFATTCFLVAFSMMVATSCKKNTDYNPTPTPTPAPTTGKYPTSIDYQKHDVRSEREIIEGKNLHVYNLHLAGKCLNEDGPEIPPGLDKIGDILKDIYNFNHPDNRFNIINSQLQDITKQLSEIQNELQTISKEIISGTLDVENWITKQAMYSNMVDIYTKFNDTTSQYALQYFPSMAARIQRGDPTAISIATLQAYTIQYYNANNNSTIANDVNAMAGQILANDALLMFTKQIILNNGTATAANQPANFMNAYLLLENYFLEIVNYQLEGMTIIANVDNYADTTGKTWANAFPGFKSMFQKEISAFHKAVNYLTCNLYDFRNTSQYTTDVVYWQMGLAPNQYFQPVHARARFVTNILLKGLGLPYVTQGGMALIPSLYGVNGNQINSLSISYGGFAPQTVNGDTLNSQFMNTFINAGLAMPLNSWMLFTFSDTSKNITSGQNSFVIESSSQNTPWPHSITIQGTYHVSYYDPKTGKSSNIRDSVYNMPFGYFSAVWYWGNQIIFNIAPSRFQKYLIYDYWLSGTEMRCENDCPSLGTTDSKNNYYPHSQYTQYFQLTNTQAGYNFSACSTDHTCYMTDAWYWNVEPMASSSPVHAFMYYDITDPGWNGTDGVFYSWAGTDLSLTYSKDGANSSNQNIFNFSDPNSTTHKGTSSAIMAEGQLHQLNAGYQFAISGQPQTTWYFGWNFDFFPAVVFTQTLPLP